LIAYIDKLSGGLVRRGVIFYIYVFITQLGSLLHECFGLYEQELT